MVDMAPDDSPKLPVERLAQFLLGCAREDPTLLARSNIDPIRRRGTGPRVPLSTRIRLEKPAPLPLMMAAARKDPELEELVSIAVACARRAEDALQHARDVSAIAYRRMSMIAVVTGTGIMIAAAAVVLGRPVTPVEPRLTESAGVAQGVTGPMAPQLVAMRSDVVAPRDTATSPDTRAAAAPARTATPAGMEQPDKPPAAELAMPPREPMPRTAPVTEAAVVTAAGIAPTSAAEQAPVSDSPVSPLPPDAPPQPDRDASSGTLHQAEAPAGQTSPYVPGTEPMQTAASEDRARPVPPVRPADHSYRRRTYREAHYYPPYRRATYVRSPPMILGQVVADVRRNLYAIFH